MNMKQLSILCVSRSGHNFIVNNVMSWFPRKKLLHYNLENVMPHNVPIQNLNGGIRLIVLRDFMNWLASLHVHLYDNIGLRDETYYGNIEHKLSVYEAQMIEALGVNEAGANFAHATTVLYDTFVRSEDYRRALCHKLGGQYSEKMLNIVPQNGRYSSFDGDKFQGEGSKMKVLDRFISIMETEHRDRYVQLIKDYQLEMELAYSIMPITEKHKSWLKKHIYV